MPRMKLHSVGHRLSDDRVEVFVRVPGSSSWFEFLVKGSIGTVVTALL